MDSTEAATSDSNRQGAKRNLTSISPFFIVKDLQASIDYYTDRLGFQVDFEGPADDRRRGLRLGRVRTQPKEDVRRLWCSRTQGFALQSLVKETSGSLV